MLNAEVESRNTKQLWKGSREGQSEGSIFLFIFLCEGLRNVALKKMLQLSQQISQQLFMFGNGSSCANNIFTCTRTSARVTTTMYERTYLGEKRREH